MKQIPEIKFLPEAFEISNSKVRYQILWEDITKIVTYKLDLLTVDEVCIDIYTSDKIYTITEQFHNWMLFMKTVEKKFSFNENWLAEVTFPPFQTNQAVLYEKHI